MITIKHLVNSDKAIASITTDECKLIASVLDIVNMLVHHWILRWFIPKAIKEQGLRIRMLAAVLGRTPEERVPLNEQIRMAMEIGMENHGS